MPEQPSAFERLRSLFPSDAKRELTVDLPGGQKLRAWYRPLTLIERRDYQRRLTKDDIAAASWLVVEKCLDESGRKLFEPQHEFDLARLPGAGTAILMAAGAMLNEVSIEDAEGNSAPSPSS